MRSIIDELNWSSIEGQLNTRGVAHISNLLQSKQCDFLSSLYDQSALYRKTVTMERHRFGRGEYKYFQYPLPDLLQSIRSNMYPHLAKVANRWQSALNTKLEYPYSLEEFHHLCKEQGQLKPTVLILKYSEGGYNTLHQDLYGDVFFPIQLVLFLTEPGADFEGGEFVVTEQVPRAQSKAMVFNPNKGDALLLTTHSRPMKGQRGYYRVNMKHGVSEVISGNRSTVGIIFHDALS